jgi:hypothetical protein
MYPGNKRGIGMKSIDITMLKEAAKSYSYQKATRMPSIISIITGIISLITGGFLFFTWDGFGRANPNPFFLSLEIPSVAGLCLSCIGLIVLLTGIITIITGSFRTMVITGIGLSLLSLISLIIAVLGIAMLIDMASFSPSPQALGWDYYHRMMDARRLSGIVLAPMILVTGSIGIYGFNSAIYTFKQYHRNSSISPLSSSAEILESVKDLASSIKKADIKKEDDVIKLISSSVFPWKYSWMIKLDHLYSTFVSTNGNTIHLIPSDKVDIKINNQKKLNGSFKASVNVDGNIYKGLITPLSKQRYETWKTLKY